MRWYIKRKNGGLSEKFLRTVFPEVLSGMKELHKNHILHLDIKPANILLRSGGHPLLIDFGAVKHMKGPRPTLRSKGIPSLRASLHSNSTTMATSAHGQIFMPLGQQCMPVSQADPLHLHRRELKKTSWQLKSVHLKRKNIHRSLLEAINSAMKMDMTQRPQSIEEFHGNAWMLEYSLHQKSCHF